MPPKPRSQHTPEDAAAEAQSIADAPITMGDLMLDQAKVPVQVAIARIIGDLPAIQKNDRGDGVSYKFRGIETLIGHLAPLLARHGVVIIPSTELLSINTEVENSKGKMSGWTEVILRVTWTLIGPAGDTLTAATIGIGRDNSDKGSNKAQTQAFKYMLMEVFAIGDKEDDSDGTPPPDAVASPPAPRTAPAAARSGGPTAPPAASSPAPPPAPSTPPNEAAEQVSLDGTTLARLHALRHSPLNKSDGQWTAVLATIARQVGQLPADLPAMVQNEAIWTAAATKYELA